MDGTGNTYLAARLVNATHDFLLAQFYADRTPEGKFPKNFSAYMPVFVEVYDHSTDPWQMNNLHPGVEKDQPELMQEMRDFMYKMNTCKGLSCR